MPAARPIPDPPIPPDASNADARGSTGRGPSLRARLILLVLLVPVPVVGVAALLVEANLRLQRDAFRSGMIETARALVQVVDTAHDNALTTLIGLATSDLLDRVDVPRLYATCARMEESQGWTGVVLADASGRTIFNTATPLGTQLPPLDADIAARLVASRRPYVSPLIGGMTAPQIVGYYVPVVRDNAVRYILGATVLPSRFNAIFASQRLPSDWIGVLEDQRSVIVARTHAVERLVGRPGVVRNSAREGWHRDNLEEGTRYVAFSTSGFSDWRVRLAAPVETIDGPVRRSLVSLALGVTLGAAVAIVLGLLFARRVTAPLSALDAWLRRADTREPIPPAAFTGTPEIATLARTLDATSRLLREREMALSAAVDEARAANRAKDEFLAVLSHELRTPLNAILGWVRMLRGGHVEPARVPHAYAVIERSARLQARLINDLLDVSRIVAGKLQLERRPVDLGPILREAVESLHGDARTKGVHLQEVVAPDAALVFGDPLRLQQVVTNLVSNAIKFTPKGGRVAVRLERAGNRARLEVADTGEGIEAEMLPHVFDRFRQADSSTRRRQGGLGLGLAIVRHLVEMHGGTVSASSPGKGLGATFTVDLPVLAVQDAPAPAAGAPPRAGEAPERLDGVRVLVVDDDPDARDLVETVLRRHGAEVQSVATGHDALAALRRGLTDVLVSDVGMADMDGFDLMRKVRALEGGAGRVPAVALTAFTGLDVKVAARAAGFEWQATKPIDYRELVRLVAEAAGRGRPPRADLGK